MENWEKRKNFGNSVAEIQQKLGERKTKRWREKEEEFQQHCYRNSSAQILARSVQKKAIAAMPLPKMGKKNLNGIMALSLPKMGEKKICCQNLGRNFKKSVIFTIFL